MALAEVICGSCGAINRASADSCWRCLETIEEPEPVPAPVAAPVAHELRSASPSSTS